MVLDAGILSEMMWRAIWNKREEAHPSQARRMGNIFQSGLHAETAKLVAPKDKSGHAGDHGVGG